MKLQVRKIGAKGYSWVVGCPVCPGFNPFGVYRDKTISGFNDMIGWRTQESAFRAAEKHINYHIELEKWWQSTDSKPLPTITN